MDQASQRRPPVVPNESLPGEAHPTAFREPTQPVRRRFIVSLVIANFGLWITIFTPLTSGLAVHLSTVLPEHERNTVLGLVLGAGGIVAMVVNPVVGKLSDRTTSRFGMRKPWIVGGTIAAIIGLVVTATGKTVPLILTGLCTATLGFNTILASLGPLLREHVPHQQRGRITGLLGMSLPIGAVGGSFLAQLFTGHPLAMFLAPAVLLVVGVALLISSYRDRRLDRAQAQALPRYGVHEFLTSFWVNPKRHPDFAWTWLSRFLFFAGLATLITFQAFYLADRLGYPIEHVAKLIAISTPVHYLLVFAASPLAGWLSDRTDRRKVFVVAAALVCAAGLGVVAFATSFPVFLVGFAITGIAEGAFIAVDLALVIDVLPHPDEAAKEMGVSATANLLAWALAPAMAPAFLAISLLAEDTHGNFVALYAAAALFAVLSAVTITPVRKVR
jgi:MFS family permease